jgi:hypothetical protein
LREAQRASGRPEEERLLDLARKDFEHAKKLYESVLPFGGAAASLRRAYDGLDRIEELRSAPAPEQHD